MEKIDYEKIKDYLITTNQEDLNFVYDYTINDFAKKSVLDEYKQYIRNVKRKYSFTLKDYLEVLYVEYLINKQTKYCLLYEDFIHCVFISDIGVVKEKI